MVNGLYDIPVDFFLKPYVGFGVGAATYSPDHIRADGMPYPGYFGGDRTNIAYQGIAGVAYNMDDNIALTLEYRYFPNVRVGFRPASAFSSTKPQSALVGIRYSFGGGERQQAAQSAALYAAARSGAGARRRSSQLPGVLRLRQVDLLSPDARGIVDQAAANAKSNRIMRNSMSPDIPIRSGRMRTTCVCRNAGRSRSQPNFRLMACLESEDLHLCQGHSMICWFRQRTAGVREPQNRRVQIVYSLSWADRRLTSHLFTDDLLLRRSACDTRASSAVAIVLQVRVGHAPGICRELLIIFVTVRGGNAVSD